MAERKKNKNTLETSQGLKKALFKSMVERDIGSQQEKRAKSGANLGFMT